MSRKIIRGLEGRPHHPGRDHLIIVLVVVLVIRPFFGFGTDDYEEEDDGEDDYDSGAPSEAAWSLQSQSFADHFMHGN
jgi:hypothetical protein